MGYGDRIRFEDKQHFQYPHAYDLPSFTSKKKGSSFKSGRYVKIPIKVRKQVDNSNTLSLKNLFLDPNTTYLQLLIIEELPFDPVNPIKVFNFINM